MRSADAERSSWDIRMSLLVMAALLLTGLSLGTSSSKAAYTVESGISYGNESPAAPSLNQLDLYRPEAPADTLSPLVVFVHGGGWRRGDKSNGILDKARLFTDSGYFFTSLNYRLSPESGDPNNPDPNRIRFPDHPNDVGAAIGWLSSNAVARGIDPDRIILIGHSAGAHLVSLVSTDPRYINLHGVDPRQILGTIPLDTAAFDIERAINRGTDPDEPNLLFTNAFGTAAENAAEGTWAEASPLTWADPSDPEHLFITQNIPYRIAESQELSDKLGQAPGRVVPVPLNHNGVNQAVGAPGDSSGTTAAITSFINSLLADYRSPGVSVSKRPAAVLRVGRKGRSGKLKKRSVRFAFEGTGVLKGLECRLDKADFKPCATPRSYTVGRGGHTFRLRAIYPSGRAGFEKAIKFKVIAKKPRR